MMNKVNVPEISTDAADKLLANVFDACEIEPSKVPLRKLANYSMYRRERYSFQKCLLILVLLVFVALPLLFIPPVIAVNTTENENGNTDKFVVRVDSWLIPVRTVTAALNGRPISVYETDSRTYTVIPTENGILEVRVVLANGQYNLSSTEITNVDTTRPEFVSSSREGDDLVLNVFERGSGLDEAAISAVTVSGKKVYPRFVDSENQRIYFNFPTEGMQITVPDKNGNKLELVISVTDYNE